MNLLYYSVINTQPGQLFYRFKYILKRKLNTSLAYYFRRRLRNKSDTNFNINTEFNLPSLVKKRNSLLKNGNKFVLSFLNETRVFSLPFNWHLAELNTGTRLWKLNLHYMEYLSETEDRDFQFIINDWIDSNPPYMKDYALDNWNSYALSIRTVVWMHEYSLRKNKLEDNFKKKFLNSLYQQISFLYNNPELDIGGNHIIKNIKALLWAGNFFKSVHSEKWLTKGEKLLEREINNQILDDGMHYELSPAYHCQVTMDLLECFNSIRYKPLRKKLFNTLTKMIQAAADLSMSDGFIAQFSDGSYHMASSPSDCLNAWKFLTKREIHQRSVFSMPSSGYYGIHKNGLDLIIDSGRLGADNLPAHGHGDIFSFELCLDKKRFIIDTGVFEYNAGVKRKYSRSTKAHNTVTLDDNDQGEFYSAFRLGRRANVQVKKFYASEDSFELIAEHDGYKRFKKKPLHERTFILSANSIYIRDSITGGKSQSVKSRLLIHPDCRIITNKNEVQILYYNSEITVVSDFDISIRDSVWYPDFGIEIPCKQLEIDYGLAPCAGEFNIYINNKENIKEKIEVLQNNLI